MYESSIHRHLENASIAQLNTSIHPQVKFFSAKSRNSNVNGDGTLTAVCRRMWTLTCPLPSSPSLAPSPGSLVNSPNDYCSIDLIDRRPPDECLAHSSVRPFPLYDGRYLSPLAAPLHSPPTLTTLARTPPDSFVLYLLFPPRHCHELCLFRSICSLRHL